MSASLGALEFICRGSSGSSALASGSRPPHQAENKETETDSSVSYEDSTSPLLLQNRNALARMGAMGRAFESMCSATFLSTSGGQVGQDHASGKGEGKESDENAVGISDVAANASSNPKPWDAPEALHELALRHQWCDGANDAASGGSDGITSDVSDKKGKGKAKGKAKEKAKATTGKDKKNGNGSSASGTEPEEPVAGSDAAWAEARIRPGIAALLGPELSARWLLQLGRLFLASSRACNFGGCDEGVPGFVWEACEGPRARTRASERSRSVRAHEAAQTGSDSSLGEESEAPASGAGLSGLGSGTAQGAETGAGAGAGAGAEEAATWHAWRE